MTERDELITHGGAVLDWIADYLENPQRFPVLSGVRPGDVAATLPASPPASAEPLEKILEDFESKIIPGITHWNHPSFFGYFATSSSVPGILAEMLVAALDVKAMLWKTSPAATELEQVVTDWLRQMLGLGHGWFGITTDTASISSMLALAAAREARPELAIRERGLAGRHVLERGAAEGLLEGQGQSACRIRGCARRESECDRARSLALARQPAQHNTTSRSA